MGSSCLKCIECVTKWGELLHLSRCNSANLLTTGRHVSCIAACSLSKTFCRSGSPFMAAASLFRRSETALRVVLYWSCACRYFLNAGRHPSIACIRSLATCRMSLTSCGALKTAIADCGLSIWAFAPSCMASKAEMSAITWFVGICSIWKNSLMSRQCYQVLRSPVFIITDSKDSADISAKQSNQNLRRL